MDFHYRLLAKSKYDIDKHYSCVFDEIDTPTEKERAEIRELNSRTDMNYINAGVVSPEEVRDVIRADEKSGYDSLSEEMEGSPAEGEDPFSDLLGGSENPQNPFRSGSWSGVPVSACGEQDEQGTQLNDSDVRVSYRNSTGAQDEWEESKHPRKKNGQFGEGGGTVSGKVEKSSKRDKIRNRERKEVQLPKEEYAQVMHELNTNLSKDERKMKKITKAIGNYLYTVENHGFNDYKITKKENLNDIY